MGAFGEKFRKQREHRGITLEAVANTTKISTRMLKALEDERFDQLPGGVFNKGFVRAYARQVGLNEEEAINDYLAALAESQVHSQPIVPNFRGAPGGPAPESKPSPIVARDTPRTAAAQDRRTQTDRRVESRRTQDRLSDDARTHDHLEKERVASNHLSDHAAIGDRPIEDSRKENRPKEGPSKDRSNVRRENGDRTTPAFTAEFSDPAKNQVQIRTTANASDSSRPNRPEKDRPKKDHPEESPPEENRPEENSYEYMPAAPPSFLNLSAPTESYQEPEPAAPEPAARRSPSTPIPWRKAALPLILVVIVIFFLALLRRNRPAAQSEEASKFVAPAQSVPAPTTSTPTTPTDAIPVAPPKAFTTNANNATSPIPSSSPPRASSDTPTPEPSSDVTRIIPSGVHASKPKPLPAFTLIIRATENSSVAITADGQSIAEENLIAPAATSVRATKEIVVKASNAAGVSFMLGGKDIPATGAEGQPHTYIFDANGLRNSTPASAENPTN